MTRFTLPLVFALGLPAVSFGAEGETSPRRTDAAIDSLVRQLGDVDFRVRERATSELLRLGPSALAALRTAERNDVEVLYRVRRITRRIRSTGPRIVRAFERDVAVLEDEAEERRTELRLEAARALEPVRDGLTRSLQLDAAAAVGLERCSLLDEHASGDRSGFPKGAWEVFNAVGEATNAARDAAARRVEERKKELLTSLGELAKRLDESGQKAAAGVARETSDVFREDLPTPREHAGSVRELGAEVGQVHVVRVKGVASGAIWGTDLYTTDSSVAVAVVHSGVLREGETGIVKITVLPGRASYDGTTRHGVTTSSWGSYQSSYRVERGLGLPIGAAAPATPGAAAVTKLVEEYQNDVKSIERDLEKRSRELMRQAAADLEPIQNESARNARLDEALGVRRLRRQCLHEPDEPPSVELPESVRGILEETERRVADVESRAARRIAERRRDVVARLERLREEFAGAGEKDGADAVHSSITALRNGYSEAIADPGSVKQLNSEPGRSHYVKVTGTPGGSVWGSDVYTTDSTIATAAVHAGVLEVGESAVVKISVLPGRDAYRGSKQNGVTTSGWGAYPMSFRVQRLFVAKRAEKRD